MRKLLTLCMIACGWLPAQSLAAERCPDPLVARQQNSRRLDLAVELDRPEYMPMEIMTTTISLRNGTEQPLEVYEPLQRGSTHLKFAGPGILDVEGEMGSRGFSFSCSGTAVTVQPGQALTRRFRSDQPNPWLGPLSRGLLSSAPHEAGDYFLVVAYRGQRFSKPFRVVPVKVEAHARLKLRNPDIVQRPDGTTLENERTVEGHVFSYGGKRYLVIGAIANAFPILRVAELNADESLDALEEENDGRIAARILSGTRGVRLISRPDPEPQ